MLCRVISARLSDFSFREEEEKEEKLDDNYHSRRSINEICRRETIEKQFPSSDNNFVSVEIKK